MFPHFRALLSVILEASSTALHAQCYQPSPNLIAKGKAYYFLQERDRYQWKADEQKAKQAVLNAAYGRWQGGYTETECFGTEKNPREVKKTAALEAQFQEAMNGILRGNAWKHFNEQNKTSSDVFELFDSRDLFAGKTFAGGIEGTQIRTRKLASGGAQMEESISRLEISGNNLLLIRDIYLNGYLGRQERYQLKRK